MTNPMMGPEGPKEGRAFCTAFKQTPNRKQTAVGLRTPTVAAAFTTSKFISSIASSWLFLPVHQVVNKGCCTIASTVLCLSLAIHKKSCFQRHLYTSASRHTPRKANLYSQFWEGLELFPRKTTDSAKMLGGTGRRRRSLRLSSSRREPLSIINDVTNANNGTYQNRPITVAVEGNIGSGKTTLLKYFQAQDGVQVVMEPVERWRENKGHNMLDLTYRDPTRWSFTFQSFVQLTMLEQHQIPHTAPIKMMERSIYSSKYCFVEKLYRSKNMGSSEYMVLTEWFDWIVNKQDLQLDQIVYLRTTPEMCHKRIKHRCRSEEQGIPLQYLKEVHDLHEEWLIHGNKKFLLPAPVMVLDASKSLEEMFDIFEEQRNQILLQG